MNPETTVKKWLLACGKQFGIDQAHEYRWADADTRPQVAYCTYRSINSYADQVGVNNLTTSTAYTVDRKGSQKRLQSYQIDLYRSQDGLYELEAFVVAYHSSEIIRNIFNGCALVAASDVQNLTTWDDEEINHHFRMTVDFTENVEISLTEVNGLVEQIDMTLETGDTTHEITDTGITQT